MLIPLAALSFVVWADQVRTRRVEHTSGLAQEAPKADAGSPTGYAGGTRELIVPERNNDSYHWIAQTQQMFARGEARVRHVDYDNAPFGREVNSASPYRWWLGLVAWIDHVVSGRPLGISVERAALMADPLLHLLVVVGATVFVAWRFGSLPAALLAIGLVTIFPFAAGFPPGAPDDRGLSQVLAFGSVLLLLGAVRRRPASTARSASPAIANETMRAGGRTDRWFFGAGLAGGLGLWISVSNQVPILVGIAIGAIFAAWLARRAEKENPVAARVVLPWRAWALGGAVASLAACLVEFFPSHLGAWELRVIHPLYGLAWLGGGEVLARVVGWIQREEPARGLGLMVRGVLGLACLAVLPVVMWQTHNLGFLASDVSSVRLTKLPGSAVGVSPWAWLIHEGITPQAWIAAWPLLLVVPAGWLMLRRKTEMACRASLALALGPVLVALGFACRYFSWWSLLDAMLLVLLVATTVALGDRTKSSMVRWVWSGFTALVFLPGAVQVAPRAEAAIDNVLNESEVFGLIERDLARGLAKHVGNEGAVVLAPPRVTTTLYFYGGLHGLGTLARENEDGIGAAIRIASASTPEEAKELIDRRGITHIVMPSWDPYLDTYARIGMGQLEGTFLNRLHLWKLPPWLRPVPYQVPAIAGFEGQSVAILEVVEEQDDGAALSRLAEYFVEMGQLDLAASVGQALRRFPADLGALVARAQVEIARGDSAGFARTIELVRSRLAGGGDRGLPWDRRASLAVVLARAKQSDLARVQVRRCLADVDETRLRSLTPSSLYRLLVLGKAFGLEMADERLRELALDLLPPELRRRL